MNSLFPRVFNLFYINGIIIYISYLISRFWFKPDTWLDLAIQFSGLVFILINFFSLALGSVHAMDIRFIYVFFTVSGITAGFLHLKYLKPVCQFPEFSRILNFKPDWFRIILISFTAMSCLLLGVVIYLNAMRYPPEQYDSLYFYLPSVVEWIKNGGIGIWQYANVDVRYYPCGTYLIVFWIMYFLKSAYFISFIQPTILIVTIITAIGIGKNLSLRSDWLIMFGFFIFTIPFYISNAVAENNDFVPMYFYILAVYFLVRLYKTREYKNLIPCAVSAGFGIGMRYSGIYWLIALTLAVFHAVFISKAKRKTQITGLITFSGIALVCGIYWYIRNFILTGNPLFPAKINLFGIPLCTKSDLYLGLNQEYLDAIQSATLLKNMSYVFTHACDWYVPLFGPGYFLLIFACGYMACYILSCLFKMKSEPILKNPKFVLFIMTSLSLVFFLSLPSTAMLPYTIRYGFPVFILVYLWMGYLAQNRFFYFATMCVFFINIAVSIMKYTRYWPYIFVVSSVFAVFISIFTRKGYLRKAVWFAELFMKLKFCKAISIMIFLLMFFLFVYSVKPFVDKHYYDTDYGYGVLLVNQDLNQGWKWISENTRADNIGYIDCVYVFPLYNIDLSNNIIFLKSKEKELLIKEIKDKSVDYLFFQTMPEYTGANFSMKFTDKFPPQQKWAEETPDMFELKYANKGVMIYEIK